MSSILEALRREHAERGDGGLLPASTAAYWISIDDDVSLSGCAAVNYSPHPTTLAGIAASMLLGGCLGVGLVHLVRGDIALRLVGGERGHESVVTQEAGHRATVGKPGIHARAGLPPPTTTLGKRDHKPHREGIETIHGADPTYPVTPVLPLAIASLTPVASQPSAPIVSAAIDKPTRKPVVLDGGASVQVFDDQRVTLTGEAASVRSVIAEICRQAGIDLRAYTAPDRRYAGRVQGEPLAGALQRILRSESYLVGLRLDPYSGETRTAWLQVVGSQAGGRAQPVVALENTAPDGVAVASAKRMLPP